MYEDGQQRPIKCAKCVAECLELDEYATIFLIQYCALHTEENITWNSVSFLTNGYCFCSKTRCVHKNANTYQPSHGIQQKSLSTSSQTHPTLAPQICNGLYQCLQHLQWRYCKKKPSLISVNEVSIESYMQSESDKSYLYAKLGSGVT